MGCDLRKHTQSQIIRKVKSYTKSENLFLRKSNLKLLSWKISIFSFEWKCVEDVPNIITFLSKFRTNSSRTDYVTVKYI